MCNCSPFIIGQALVAVLLFFLRGAQGFLAPHCQRAPHTCASSVLAARKRKNKYENFSKVTPKDPLEVMMEEAVQKNQQLVEEQQLENGTLQTAPEALSLEFPDNKAIDPYDPTTFGYIEIGIVLGAHGVKGQIKVEAKSDCPERLTAAGLRHLKKPNKRAPRQMQLVSGRLTFDNVYLVTLEGINSREEAQSLRGSTLYVREEEQLETEADEYLVSDLVGLDVFLMDDTEDLSETRNRQFVGTVGTIVFGSDMGIDLGHDYLELILPRGIGGTNSVNDELVLIPFVPQIVPQVDLSDQCIYVDPPGGLLDLKYVREEKTRIKGFLPASDD